MRYLEDPEQTRLFDVFADMFHVDVQYALNLQPEPQRLCRRTIERDLVLFGQSLRTTRPDRG